MPKKNYFSNECRVTSTKRIATKLFPGDIEHGFEL